MRLHVLLNYTVVFFLCCTILCIATMNAIEQATPHLIHLRSQPELGCNGRVEFCDRSYSNVTQIAAHDSAFVGILPMDNQNVHVEKQLDAGIRFLQTQTRLDNQGRLSNCHTDCGLKDAGSLTYYLETIKLWLDAHPNEVVTVLLTNPDYANITLFASAFTTSNLTQHAYTRLPTHKPTDPRTWPTLAQLIANHTRLIAFIDTGADDSPASPAPYILPEFTYFWETPFDTTDPKFPQCAIDRPQDIAKAPARVAQRMYLVNHFLDTHFLGMDVPNRRDAGRTNRATGEGSIGAQVDLCVRMHGGRPKGVLVDFFDKGEIFRAQDALNGF